MDSDKRYIKLERIGKGSYGQVFKVYYAQTNLFHSKMIRQDKHTGQILAAKIINLEDKDNWNDEGLLEDLLSEIQILSQCSSPHIVKYKGTFFLV